MRCVAFLAALLAVGAVSPATGQEVFAVAPPTKGYQFFGWWTPVGSAPSVLHWRFGIELGDFPGTMQEALEAAADIKVANYVADETQRVGWLTPRRFGPELFPGERGLAATFTESIIAYRVAAIPHDAAAARRLFEFAKSMKVETIVVDDVPEQPTFIDELARQYGINVALCGRYEAVAAAVSRAERLGACVSEAELSKEHIAPTAAAARLGNRIVIAEISSDITNGTSEFLRALYDHGVKPSLIVIRRDAAVAPTDAQDLKRAIAALDSVLRPLIADSAMKRSKRPDQGRGIGTAEQNRAIAAFTPGNSLIWEPASPANKQAIDAAIPNSPIVKPAKPRKLLVLDFNLAYPGHTSIPTHNYALQRLGAVTGAYEATFDNDLENLKYPRIKRFDAIFLNNTVGLIFSDEQVREGLTRFVREGGGLGGNHASTHASLDWPEFAAMIGAYPGGHLDPTEEVWLKIDDPDSAINAAFKGQAFKYQDEYFRFPGPSYSRDHLHVLLSIDVARTDMFQVSADRVRQMTSVGGARILRSLEREDADFAVSWIKTYGQGRVFYTTLGHTPALFMTPEMAHHMLGGLQYILGDLPADASPSATVLSSSRP